MTETYIFVYGSLRKGLKNHHYLENSEYIEEFISDEEFYLLAYENLNFPYLLEELAINKPKTKIKGEIYKINDNVLKKIDNLESNNEIYQRKIHKFSNNKNNDFEAYVYILIKPIIIDYITKNLNKNYFLIESGDWVEFLYSGK